MTEQYNISYQLTLTMQGVEDKLPLKVTNFCFYFIFL